MSSELSQLIESCLKDKREQRTLPKLPKIVSSDSLKITFQPESNEALDEVDLLTRFPVMESGYMTAKLIELNLLNATEKGEDQNGSLPEDDRKEKRNIYEAWLEFETNEQLEFHPGDSIGMCALAAVINFDFNPAFHPIKAFQLAISTLRLTS